MIKAFKITADKFELLQKNRNKKVDLIKRWGSIRPQRPEKNSEFDCIKLILPGLVTLHFESFKKKPTCKKEI